jgi:hypothetical protein
MEGLYFSATPRRRRWQAHQNHTRAPQLQPAGRTHSFQRPDAHMRSHPPQRAGCQQTSLLHPVSPAPATVDAGPVPPHWRRSWHPPVSNKGPTLARFACLPWALSPCSASLVGTARSPHAARLWVPLLRPRASNLAH